MSWAKVKYRSSSALGNNIPSAVRAFGLFLRNPRIEEVKVGDVMNYINLMTALGWHPITICRKIAHIRNFFRFLQLQGLPVVDYRIIPSPQPQFSQPSILTEEEYRKIISVIATKELQGARDIAQISLLHDTGVRVGELLSLNIDDIDVRTKHVAKNGIVVYRSTVRTEKQRSKPPFRQIYWLEDTNRHLANWLHIRELLANSRDPKALFLSTSQGSLGRRLHPRAVQVVIRKYSLAAGVIERVHPHMFRHAFARSRVLGGADTSAIASLLGHADIESSGIYTRLYGEQLQDAYTRFMPPDQEMPVDEEREGQPDRSASDPQQQ